MLYPKKLLYLSFLKPKKNPRFSRSNQFSIPGHRRVATIPISQSNCSVWNGSLTGMKKNLGY